MHSETDLISVDDLRLSLDEELRKDREAHSLHVYLLQQNQRFSDVDLSACEAFVYQYIDSSIILLEALQSVCEDEKFRELNKFSMPVLEYWYDSLDLIPAFAGILGRLDDAFLTNAAWYQLVTKSGRVAPTQLDSLESANAYAAAILPADVSQKVFDYVANLVAGLPDTITSIFSELDDKQFSAYYSYLPRIPDVAINQQEGETLMRSDELSEEAPGLPDDEEEANGDSYTYDVWFGTNRAPIDSDVLSLGFLNERDPEGQVYYGQCSVEIPKSHTFGSIGTVWYKRWIKLRFADDHVKLKNIEVLSSRDEFAGELKDDLARLDEADRCILLYIHGFNVSFEEGAIRAAQFGFDLKVPGATAFYSWPSKAATKDYMADIARIEASEAQLADFLGLLAKETGATTVHVVAHSMGNRGFGRAISRITAHASRISDIRLGQIILAAPDLDVDLFKEFAKIYPEISERTTMYVSAKDKALGLSSWIQDSNRAGFTPPVTIQPGIDTVEVTDIDLTMLGHGYFAAAAAVLYDIKELIDNSTPPERRLRISGRKQDGKKYWVFKE